MAPDRFGRTQVELLRVIFDSSFLMAVVETPTTWFEDIVEGVGKFEPVTLECVQKEMRALVAAQGRRGKTATVALDLSAEFAVWPCGGAKPDDEIVSAALSNQAAVATVDGALSKALEASHVKVITLRKGRVWMR